MSSLYVTSILTMFTLKQQRNHLHLNMFILSHYNWSLDITVSAMIVSYVYDSIDICLLLWCACR